MQRKLAKPAQAERTTKKYRHKKITTQYIHKVDIPTCLSGVFRYRSKKNPIRLSRDSAVSSGYNNCARRGSSIKSSINLQDFGLFFVAHICSALYRQPSCNHSINQHCARIHVSQCGPVFSLLYLKPCYDVCNYVSLNNFTDKMLSYR